MESRAEVVPLAATSTRASAEFATGVGFVLRGIRMLATNRPLWVYCAISALVMFAILAGALTFTVGHVDDWLGAVWARPESMLWRALWYCAAIGLALAAGYLALVASVAVAGIVLAPLHDRLSERVEQLAGGRGDETFRMSSFIRDVGTGIAHTIFNLALFAAIGIPVVLLNVLPGLGSLVSAVAGSIFTGFMLAMEMCDYAMSRRRLAWGAKWGVIRRRPWLFLGFGLAVAALLWIPFVGAISVPAAVISGTLLVVAVEQSDAQLSRRPVTGEPFASAGAID